MARGPDGMPPIAMRNPLRIGLRTTRLPGGLGVYIFLLLACCMQEASVLGAAVRLNSEV